MRVTLGLGSNVGDRLAHLRFAVAQLRAIADVVASSSVYETTPIGGPTQGDFLNAVVEIAWPRRLVDLLDETREIEHRAGRVRSVRWGPRTLDIDLLYAEQGVHTDTLMVPHPRLFERAFVLVPLLDVASEPLAQHARLALSQLADAHLVMKTDYLLT